MSEIQVVISESEIGVFVPSDIDAGFTVLTGTFPDGTAQSLDSVLGPNAQWDVDFEDGSGNYITCQVTARDNGVSADWIETNVVTNIAGVPLPVIAVSLSVANLALSATAALGWTWRVRRSSWA